MLHIGAGTIHCFGVILTTIIQTILEGGVEVRLAMIEVQEGPGR